MDTNLLSRHSGASVAQIEQFLTMSGHQIVKDVTRVGVEWQNALAIFVIPLLTG